jgi:hypothetical protein
VRDYFYAYRNSQDIVYRLKPDEVGVMTEVMHVVEERMGYLYRKSQDLPADMGIPFGRNLKLQYHRGEHDRDSYKDDLCAIAQAAEVALSVINKNIGRRTGRA